LENLLKKEEENGEKYLNHIKIYNELMEENDTNNLKFITKF
jgi:hypothetical protein